MLTFAYTGIEMETGRRNVGVGECSQCNSLHQREINTQNVS